jgi:hypothetical protein
MMRKPPEKYWALFKVAHERITPLLKAGLRPDLLNPVFDLPVPMGVQKGPEPTANERYWLNWFQDFGEVDASLTRLDQALVYLSHYPSSRVFRFHGLSEADWIRYHVEAYLQETYILSERLRRFLKKVEKTAIAARDKAGLSAVKRLKAGVEATLKNVVKVRGGHVHRHRFQDDELKNLDTLVLVTKGGKMREFREFRRLKFVAALDKWRTQLLINNKETEKLCVAVFVETAAILTRNEPTRN